MPEGDAISRATAALRTALVGRRTVGFSCPSECGPAPSIGRVVEAVRHHGRDVEVEWDDGLTLHTHLRMSGAWQLYRAGDRWRRPSHEAVVSIETREWVAVCFNAQNVDLFRAMDRRRHPGMGGLGPDLNDAEANLRRCVKLLARYPDGEATIADVMLDERVLQGLGNVGRAEVLWACQLNPFARVGELSRDDVVAIVRTAAEMMRATAAGRSPLSGIDGLDGADPQEGLAVYGRNGQLCYRCHGTVEARQFGVSHRVLYWCPECQHRLDRRVSRALSGQTERPLDPHPAAVLYLADARAARERRRGQNGVAFG